MRSKPAYVKKLEKELADMGCVLRNCPGVHIHHIFGRSAVQNKQPVGWAGILALSPELHNDLHTDRKSFVEKWFLRKGYTRWEPELILYQRQREKYERHYGKDFPVPDECYAEIMGYSR